MHNTAPKQLHHEPLGNYLRTHRAKAGISQRDLGRLLGYDHQEAVSRHELSRNLPPLTIAVCYEVLYSAPISELFPGIRITAEQVIEKRLLEFERALLAESSKGSRAILVAQQLAWLSERRNIREA